MVLRDPQVPGVSSGGQLPEDASVARRTVARVRRHLHWARHEGLGRIVEEDRLDPRARVRAAVESRRWVRAQGVEPGQARAVFVVGVQRSGTNMVVHGVETDPSVRVYNENSRRAFDRFQLRGPDVTRDLVTQDRHRLVLFKALCDSHRTTDLLAETGAYTSARAVWVFRGVDGRVRSAVSKFGDVNRRVLAEIAAGEAERRWQAQRLSAESLELIRSVDPATLSPESGAALFWLVRNRLYFEQRLHARPDVHLVAYEQFVAEPERTAGALCSFLDLPYGPRLVAHVEHRSSHPRRSLELDPRIRAACDDLEQRLTVAAAESRERLAPPTVR